MDGCRRRIQQELHGHKGQKNDPVYPARRLLRTRFDLLGLTQVERLNTLFDSDDRAAVEVSWGLYQHVVAASRTTMPGLGKN